MNKECAMSVCEDNRVHVFEYLSDGVSIAPVCGAALTQVRAPEDSEHLKMCSPCTEALPRLLGLDPEAFREELENSE